MGHFRGLFQKGPLYFPFFMDQNQLFEPKSTFVDQNQLLTRDHDF